MGYGEDGLFVQKIEENRKMEIRKDKDGLILNTIGELLDRNAKLWPDKDALMFCEQNLRYTWFELKNICDIVAKGFMGLGIKKGDHIAIWATNVPEWTIAYFAAEKIGAAIVTMNPEWKQDEVEYALKQSDTDTLIMIEGFTKQTSKGVEKYNSLDIIQKVCPELTNPELKPGKLESKMLQKLKNIILI